MSILSIFMLAALSHSMLQEDSYLFIHLNSPLVYECNFLIFI